MRTFAQKGRWSITLTAVNSMQIPTTVVTLSRRLTQKERNSLGDLSVMDVTPVMFRYAVRASRCNVEDPKKGKYFGKIVVEFGFITVGELLGFVNNFETTIRQYENSIKHRVTPATSPVSKELQG